VTVKGIPVFWKAPLFAGRRRKKGLGRSVASAGIPPQRCRADDSGCPEVAEEGNAVAHAPQSACTRRRHERSSHALRGRVLRSVLRPVRVDPHYAPRRKLRWWGERLGITVGQTCASGRNQHWGRAIRTLRGSPRVILSREGEGVTRSRKGRRSRSPSLRGSRVRVRLPAHRWYVAEVGRRRLVSNTLGKRAPKRAARVE
jgi:hypothetical protein